MLNDNAIYIIFSSTHCGVGSFIRFMTGGFYNHVSVSFDPNLNELYSFARFYKHAPLYGGFVHESGMRYRMFNTPIKVCRITLSNDEYNRLRLRVNEMLCNRDRYIYNMLSAMTYPFHLKVNIASSYTCVEFAAHLLASAGFANSENNSGFCSIKNLETLLADKIIYEGVFPESSLCDWQDDTFNEKIGIIGAIKYTIRNNARLLKRMLSRTL